MSWFVIGFSSRPCTSHLTPARQVRPTLTIGTSVMWALTGGMLGTVIRLQEWDTTGYSFVSLLPAAVASVAFLLLEYMGNEQHRAIRH
jgi:hypothetical protein